MAEYLQDTTAKNGWNAQEQTLLAEELERAQKNGESLRPAFERVAQKTGRKASSVRNYYYTVYRRDQKDAPHRAFETFTDEQIEELLRFILSARAQGKSVRSAAMELGKFDQSAMLRYQNKYRSLIKNRPDLVRSVVESMRRQGVPVFDPYAKTQEPMRTADTVQIRLTLASMWRDMQRQLMRMPPRKALSLVEGLSCLFDAALRRQGDTPTLLAENEALRRENMGLVRQLEMIRMPVDGDALARRANGRDIVHPLSHEVSVFLHKRGE